jgi:hypothetical protein
VTALHSCLYSFCIVLALTTHTVWALNSPARELSADIVGRHGDGADATTVARLYAAHGKVRIEPVELAGSFLLIDHEAASTLLVRPGQRVYMKARQSSVLTEIFVPIDIADPCGQWRSAVEDAGGGKGAGDWRCERYAKVNMHGRKAFEFHTASAGNTGDKRFIDVQLQFPLKAIAADGSSLTLENIHVSVQQAELFTLPRDYRLFDPRAVVERIKHSDVWAEPATP